MTDNAYVQQFDGLWATSLNPEAHERTVGYWYTVTCGAVAHAGFKTSADLDRWLTERGLELSEPLPAPGQWASVRVYGSYRRSLDRDQARFGSLNPVLVTTDWDNGELTTAKITEAAGVRTVRIMNVNYRQRRR